MLPHTLPTRPRRTAKVLWFAVLAFLALATVFLATPYMVAFAHDTLATKGGAESPDAAIILAGTIGVVFVLGLYFLPSVIALARSHHNAAAITVLNFLLGWTLLGWVAALVWALTSPPRAPAGAP